MATNKTAAIIQYVGSNTSVNVNPTATGSTWIKIVPTPDDSRTGISIDNPSTNSGNQVFVLANRTTNFTTTAALTAGIYELPPGTGMAINVSGFIDIYGFSRHSATESCAYQEHRS